MHPIQARIRAAVAESGWQAVIATSPENVTYAAGCVVPTQKIIPHRHAACLTTAAGRHAMLVVDMEYNTVRRYARLEEIRPWAEFTDDPMARIADLLQELGVSRGTVGLELHHLPAAEFLRLQGFLPEVKFVDAGHWFGRVRMIKVEEELDRLRRIGAIADGVHASVYQRVRAGDTERDLGRHIAADFFGRGAGQLQLMVVASGNRSGLPNSSPTERVMQSGDLIRVDLLGSLDGYLCDVARTAVVTAPTAKQQAVWQRVMETHHLLLDMIRPGVHTRDIYAAFQRQFEKYGLPVSRFVGHGLGIHVHEEPFIGFNSTEVLQENMVLCIEPFIFSDGDGYQVEDEVIVTKDGYELITRTCSNERLITTGA